MSLIQLTTVIQAPVARCFDLSRSIDLHQVSTAHTHEKAVAGRTNGLIELYETVTWEAVHFGIRQRLTSAITKMEKPFYFRDEMVKGAFRKMVHDHFFEEKEGTTYMKDVFFFQSPLGMLGKLADKWLLTAYLERLLVNRNQVIKAYAETVQWEGILP